jgi:hypothetical protein
MMLLHYECNHSTKIKNKALQLRWKAFLLSGWQDSNLRPSGPKPDALTGLRYTPQRTPKLQQRRTSKAPQK